MQRKFDFSTVAGLVIGVAIWTGNFKGNPVAMGSVTGVVAMILVLTTKYRFLGRHQFIAMPQAFLGAPAGLLFWWLQPFALNGPAQPHIAGLLAIVSVFAGVVLGTIYQNAPLGLSNPTIKVSVD